MRVVLLALLVASVPATALADDANVTVVGTRVQQTAGAAHVVTQAELEKFGQDDPHAIVTKVPGVYARGEDGFGLRPNIGLRGVNPDRSKKVSLFEDGVPFAPAPYSAPAAYYFPLMARMTAVRVIKGPAAITYGPQTVGGAIDLVTRSIPATPSGSVDLAVGSYGYGRMHAWAGSGDEKMGFLLEGMHLRSDGFKTLPSGADTGFVRNEWMAKGYYVPGTGNELRIKLSYSDEVSNETYLGLTDGDFRANPLRRYPASALDSMRWHRTAIALTHVLTPAPGVEVTTTAYRNDFARTWRRLSGFRGVDVMDVLNDPTSDRNALFAAILRGEADYSNPAEALLIGPNQREFVSQGVQMRVRYDGSTGPFAHRLEYGTRVHHDSIDRRHSTDAFHMTRGELLPEGSATVVTAYEEASTIALAMHALDAITWNRLTLTPGVRVEALRSLFVDKTTGTRYSGLTQVVLPGAGAFYALTKDVGLLGGVHRGFSPPVPDVGGPSRPELSVNYEGGARFWRGKARAEVIGFYNDYSNLTDVCTLSSGCNERDVDRQFDAGRARIYGLEAYVSHAPRVGSFTFPVSASYTLTRAEFATDFRSADPIFGDVRRGDTVPYVPSSQGNVTAGVQGRRAGFDVALNYLAPMREVAGSEPLSRTMHTDEVVTLDLGARWQILEQVQLHASVRNLFDDASIVARRPFGARPNAPRWIQIGARAEF